MTGLNDDVTTEVAVGGGEASGRGHRIVLRLSWRRDDPLAVALLVTPEPDHPSLPSGRWVVLRDFLRYGLEEPTGDGDVRIRPTRDGVHLQLLRGTRPCSVVVPLATVRAFLDQTEGVVPAGEERSEAALDALISRLLGC